MRLKRPSKPYEEGGVQYVDSIFLCPFHSFVTFLGDHASEGEILTCFDDRFYLP